MILTSIHILAGSVTLASGTLALSTKKGARLHRRSGNVFLVSMLVMGLLGAYLAIDIPEVITVINGLFVCYLVMTSWLAAGARRFRVDLLHYALALFGLAISISHFYFGYIAMSAVDGLMHGFSVEPYFFFGTVAAVATILDAVYIVRRRMANHHRIARHLWRMCFAFFITTAALFLGQEQIFPEHLQGSVVLALPVLLVLITMFYWLAIALFSRRFKPRASSA